MAVPTYLTDAPETLEHSMDFYACDLTRDDVDELRVFLQARCEEVYSRYRASTPEARLVQAFFEAAGARLTELEELVGDHRPEALSERANAWDYLMHIVAPWRGTPGHNAERWRTIKFTDEPDFAAARRTVEETRDIW